MIIKFITGVMGAGKSAQLIDDEAYYESVMNKRVAIIKASLKERHKFGQVKSRNGNETNCLIININQTESEVLALLSFYIEQFMNVDYIFVDEAQFLSPEHINAIENVALIFGTDIVFYGLSTDYSGKQFEGSSHIMEICDEAFVLPAECEKDDCERDAVYNGRFVDDKLVIKGKQIVEEKGYYKSLCPMCYEAERRNALLRQ